MIRKLEMRVAVTPGHQRDLTGSDNGEEMNLNRQPNAQIEAILLEIQRILHTSKIRPDLW